MYTLICSRLARNEETKRPPSVLTPADLRS
jgi:hypothetical protein